MFLAKPLRFRADLVCARSYAGRAPFFGAALFCALLTLCARSTREFRRATPLRELLPASTSARTRLASCPRKSRCVTLPCELLWRIPVSEPTLRSCRGSVDTVACDPVPAPVPQISLAQALDVRLTCGFVPRLASMLRSIRGGGASRPARRGRRIHAVRELWQGDRPARTKMPLCWQDVANMRSPGACRWQNACEMRSRAAIRGKFFTPCIPKVASDGKIASLWQHIVAVYPK